MGKRCTLGSDSVSQALAERIDALHKAMAAASDHNMDGIHDMRVASRRLRAVLNAHKRFFEKSPLQDFQCRIRGVTSGLGTARELDVSIVRLEKERKKLRNSARTAANQILRKLRALRKAEATGVEAGCHLVKDKRFKTSHNTLVATLKPRKECYLDTAEMALAKRQASLCKSYEKWRQTRSEEDLHQVRIAFKRLRYSCEIFKFLYGEAMQAFIKDLKNAQERLGDWNDLRVLRGYVERMAPVLRDTASEGVAMLHGELDRKVDQSLEAFEEGSATFFAEDALERMRILFRNPTRACCNPARRKTLQSPYPESLTRENE